MSCNSEVLFTNHVKNDLQKFIELQKSSPGGSSSVLLFPPVDNFKRFLIHRSIADTDNLHSFSIGLGVHRRTVVCEKKALLERTKPTWGSSVDNDDNGDRKGNVSNDFKSQSVRIKDQKRRPDRQVYVPRGARSDVARRSDKPEPVISQKNMSADKSTGSKCSSIPVKKAESTDEEDDWDSLYADDGACLDPKIVEELTSAVGNVRILPAASTAQSETEDAGEFSHVLEISNFPVEFKTQDLMMMFLAYKEKEIKWVDDTHAIIIFSSAKIANEALAIKYPGVKLKRMKDASEESKSRAKRSGAVLPYKARPETCASLARRLVTGALGMKSRATKDVLEKERRILQEARDRKRAQKEHKDVWDDDEDDPS